MFEIGIILLMLAISAFFSGSEIAFVAANRLKVEVVARRSGRIGRIVQRFVHNPETFLTTTLVGNNLALVLYSTLMAYALEGPLSWFFISLLGLDVSSAAFAVFATQTIIASVLVLLLGEVIPKTIMREFANRMVFALAVPLRLCYVLLYPLVKVAGWTAQGMLRLFRADSSSMRLFIRRDFEAIIEEGKTSGTLELDEEESTMLANVFALGTLRVKETMVPRTDIVAIANDTPMDVVREQFVESGHSKLPVYEENIDRIVGVVFAYDLFSEPETLASMLRSVQYVPETKRARDLLQEFLATNTSIAIVIDEYGGTAGMVTREDLLEELLGDIQDEFDTEDEVLRQVDTRTFHASGRVEIDDLEERFGIHIPDGDYETVGGYIMEELGRIPKVKETFELDAFRFTVLRATPTRVVLVRMVRIGEGE